MIGVVLVLVGGCQAGGTGVVNHSPGSPARGDGTTGRLEAGIRVVDIQGEGPWGIKAWRGDYLQLRSGSLASDTVFLVPGLGFQATLEEMKAGGVYLKLKEGGGFDFSLGSGSGRIEVEEYRGEHYREVSLEEARDLVAAIGPRILDVRTPGEYQAGHLPGAYLLPVAELEDRLSEIQDWRDEEILVYCASGNRSTVASRLMVDAGFLRVNNLRGGYGDWARRGYPTSTD